MKQAAAILLALFFLPLSTVLADEIIRGKYEVIGDIDKLKGVKTIFWKLPKNFELNLKTSYIIKNIQYIGVIRHPTPLRHSTSLTNLG